MDISHDVSADKVFIIAVVLVLPHEYFFATSLSGNIRLNKGPALSAVAIGKLLSIRNCVNEASA